MASLVSHNISLLGAGFIGMFYTHTLHSRRGRDRVMRVYSNTAESAREFATTHGIPRWTTDMWEAVTDRECDTVLIGLPNSLHEEAVALAAKAGKAVLCTKPLGRTAEEARRMLEAVKKAGVFGGYLEDLVYTPKTLKSLEAVKNGQLGEVLWVRSRETHPGPHSPWFWDAKAAGGGAIIDMGCHTVEIIRNFVGKENRPVEVMCWADTLVHPIDAEDHGIGLIRFESGAVGQFEVSWAFHGGMDLRDEVSGTQGTLFLNHWLRTGFEMFTKAGGGYVAEKAEVENGWLFPVGDEPGALGYTCMFDDMFDAMDAKREPMETFYDGVVVNAVIDAAYKSAKTRAWEPVDLPDWPYAPRPRVKVEAAEFDGKVLIKEERMPDGTFKRLLKDKITGEVTQIVS